MMLPTAATEVNHATTAPVDRDVTEVAGESGPAHSS
jgi:hypothetical protein